MEKTSSQKASVRHLLKQMFPGAFFKGYPLEEPDVVGEDAIMSIRCIGDRETITQPGKDKPHIPNTRSYAKCIKKTAEWNLKYKDCKHYLMCFDIDKLVPTTKGEEQGHRDTSQSEKDLERECDMEDQGLTPLSQKEPPYFDLDDPFPVDFAIGMKDRNTFRPWVLGWTARQLICSEDPTLRIDIPTGKTLLISGHRLTEEDADFLDIDGREGLTDRERMCTPVLLTGTDPGDFPDVSFASWAKNEIGEGEFQIFTLHRLVHEHTKKDLTLDCISTDSDFINLSLIYLEKFPSVNQITWRYAPRQGWIYYREIGSVSFSIPLFFFFFYSSLTFFYRNFSHRMILVKRDLISRNSLPCSKLVILCLISDQLYPRSFLKNLKRMKYRSCVPNSRNSKNQYGILSPFS